MSRLTQGRLRQIIKEELSRAIREAEKKSKDMSDEEDPDSMNEAADDDYYGDDDPFGDDEAIRKGLDYDPATAGYRKKDSVVDAYSKMRRKPMGAIIIDCSETQGEGGGLYPAYYADGITATKFSKDVGAFAFDLLGLMAENGRLPVGIYVAGPNPETGVFEITNKA